MGPKKVLAYLLTQLAPSLESGLHHKTTKIFFGGLRTYEDDDEAHLQHFSRILLNLTKSK